MKGKDVILGLLMEKPHSGYDINENFKRIFSHFFDGGYGMIYPTLRNLEKDGEIVKEVIVQEGKPNKNVYTITSKGRESFQEYLNSKVKPDVLQSDFLMRMFFGEYTTQEQLGTWIEEEIFRREDMLEQLREDFEHWKAFMTEAQLLSYDVGIATYEACLSVLRAKLAAWKGEQDDES